MRGSVARWGWVVVALGLSGCVTVSYEELERVDQATAGNRGYLVGEAPEIDEAARPTTRTVTRMDVELMAPKEAWQRWRGQSAATAAPGTSGTSGTSGETAESASQSR